MKRLFDPLSSMHLTTVILAVLILWFTWGILLAESDTFQQGFRVMNTTLTPVWFSQPGKLSFLLKLWFTGLCTIMGVLGINLIFCSWTKILKLMKNRHARAKLIMLIIHVVFGLVALGHFGSFVLGYRYENVRLREGQSFPLSQGYEVAVTAVHFADDPALLQRPRKEWTAGSFHPQNNYGEVTLTHHGNSVASGRIFALHPLTHKDLQVTLKRFTLPEEIQKQGRGTQKPGVILIISKIPTKPYVFVLFPIMIAGIGIYMIMTWRTRRAEKLNSRE